MPFNSAEHFEHVFTIPITGKINVFQFVYVDGFLIIVHHLEFHVLLC